MPYDSNGNFSLVSGYRATAGETILPSQHNPPLEDIASALSQVLLRSGIAPMMGPLNMNSYGINNLAVSSDPTSPATNQQLLDAITELQDALEAQRIPVGALLPGRWAIAPAGWVKENGGTIGSAASGATTRANADTQALFTHLWTSFNNTLLPIQTSTGAASTRGASASADFAANKRMPLFDSRSRFLRAADDGLGYDGGLSVGAAQDDAIKNHVHTGTTGASGVTLRTQSGGSFDAGNPFSLGRIGGTSGTATADITDHVHSFSTSTTTGGIALETRPRSTVALFCIKL